MSAGQGPNVFLSIAIVVAFIIFIYLKVTKKRFNDMVDDLKDLIGGTKNAR